MEGRIWNDEVGVKTEAFGISETLDTFRGAAADGSSSSGGDPRDPVPADSGREPFTDLVIVPSERGEEELGPFNSLDLATCPECLREIFDPDTRRYQY